MPETPPRKRWKDVQDACALRRGAESTTRFYVECGGLPPHSKLVSFSSVILSAGSRVGPYEIVAPIGAGGMGEVYRARDPRIGRDVAIKVLPAKFAVDEERLLRFQQEARAAGALNHPNLISVYDIGEHDGKPYIVEELLEGE